MEIQFCGVGENEKGVCDEPVIIVMPG